MTVKDENQHNVNQRESGATQSNARHFILWCCLKKKKLCKATMLFECIYSTLPFRFILLMSVPVLLCEQWPMHLFIHVDK